MPKNQGKTSREYYVFYTQQLRRNSLPLLQEWQAITLPTFPTDPWPSFCPSLLSASINGEGSSRACVSEQLGGSAYLICHRWPQVADPQHPLI